MATSHSHGGDRLSALPDSALVRVLSHLASDEAVRSSVLSRRWLDVYQAVPVVNLVDTNKGERYGCGAGGLKVCFDHQVTSAILSKGMTTPIHTFRLSVLQPPYDLLNQWIGTIVTSGVQDLDVKLRYRDTDMPTLCPLSASADLDENETEGSYTKTHRQIFGCTTLRRLRLKNWTLDLPPGMVMESLETLCLARIMDPDGLLQQLVSSCPRLVDLTLQECPSIKEISVPSRSLRSFAMICCHNASSVELHTTCLQSLHYKGGLPPRRSSFFTVANYQGIKAATIEICEKLCSRGSDVESDADPDDGLDTDADASSYEGPYGESDTEPDVESDTEPKDSAQPKNSAINNGVEYSSWVPESLWCMYVRCLDRSVRRINIGNYKVRPLEKMLSRFLLSRAAALEEFLVTLAAGLYPQKDEIGNELASWRWNRCTRVTCKQK
ncbi:hypothetical protein ACQ4PT_030163 [Festuca glaucescens]